MWVGAEARSRLVLLSLSANRRQTELGARGKHRQQGRKGQEKDRVGGWAHRRGWRGEEEEEEVSDSPRCRLGMGFSSRPFYPLPLAQDALPVPQQHYDDRTWRLFGARQAGVRCLRGPRLDAAGMREGGDVC